jgi:hypothetical protein
MKRISLILFFCLFLSFLLFNDFCFAERPLEVDYPEIGGIRPETVGIGIPDYIKYIFNFAIWIVGLVAFGALIYGGARYVTSAGSPAAMADAKGQIFAGILGLIIVLSSYLILTNINPQLKIVSISEREAQPILEHGGVLLCESQEVCQNEEKCLEDGTCALYVGDAPSLYVNDFYQRATYIKIKNTEETDYFAITHEAEGYIGDCQVVEGDGSLNFKPGSIFVFQKSTEALKGGEGVTFYRYKDHNKDCKEDQRCYKKCPCEDCGCRGPYLANEYPNLGFEGYSIEIEGPFVVLVKGGGKCQVFVEGHLDVSQAPIGVCADDMGCFHYARIFQVKK